MTKQEMGTRAVRFGESLDYWRKILSAVVMLGSLAGAAWVQFLGPGIKSAVQDFVGISEIAYRLEEVERNMPPPSVVEWNERIARQIGNCTPERCTYVLNGARTDYGENCGAPSSITPYVRTSAGQNIAVSFDPTSGSNIELTRTPLSFTVHLSIPTHLGPGDHSWRARVIYPDCPGRGEPIPRWTPWFPLKVTTD